MAVALKDFQYFDRALNQSVRVRRGDTIPATVENHGVDLAKLGRTKYVDLQSEGVTRTPEPVRPKRGRPRKER